MLFYFNLGLFQWLIYILFYSRCIDDKIGKFIDFCSVSNISVFILTHAQYGYYIHGRSPHGFADKNMQNMIQSLMREELGMTARRGLEAGYDQQTFSISLNYKLSKQYSKVIQPVNEVFVLFFFIFLWFLTNINTTKNLPKIEDLNEKNDKLKLKK